jgi:7-carboxy-7-deazaguanine synthase
MISVDDFSTKLPIVEIFQSIEGEGMKAGFPTTFIRLFGCNLNCSWCDTKYSNKPYKPGFVFTIPEIINQTIEYKNENICLTGGEPLLHGEKCSLLIQNLFKLDFVNDIHIETNGSIDLEPFVQLRAQNQLANQKVRFIMDYKLPSSGETSKMFIPNFRLLQEQDEIKFVVANDQDFYTSMEVLNKEYLKGQPLFSAVWESMTLERLASFVMDSHIKNAKLNVQLHKVIWGIKQGV